jgi:hypothetical protein
LSYPDSTAHARGSSLWNSSAIISKSILDKDAAGAMSRARRRTRKVCRWPNVKDARRYAKSRRLAQRQQWRKNEESMRLGQCHGLRMYGVRTWREAEAAALTTVPRCCSRHSAVEFRFQIKTELSGKLDRFKGWRSPAVFGVPPMARRALRCCVGVRGSASRLGDGGGLPFCDFFARRCQRRALGIAVDPSSR